MRGVSVRRLVARVFREGGVDAEALVAARRACGSWEGLEIVLREERLAALLAFLLAGTDLPVESRFKERLRSLGRGVLASNIARRKLYESLRTKLATAGIPALPIKGIDVAFAAYPHPSCRPMTDIDILVAPENYRAADEILREEGFSPVHGDPRWWPGRTFAGNGGAVDLHWSPAAALPPRRGMASLCYLNGDKNAGKDEFRLLISVCHHQNHFFSLPLLDFYETLLLAGRVAWPRYWSLARRWGAVRATRFVLALARAFLGEGRATAGEFSLLKILAGPALSGADPGRGARAAAVYALSYDNPAAALALGIRRPAWAREVLTRSSLNGERVKIPGRRKTLEVT